MTREEFKAFQQKYSMSQKQIGKVFCMSQGNVSKMLSEKQESRVKIQKYYSRIYQLLSLFTEDQRQQIINSIIGG